MRTIISIIIIFVLVGTVGMVTAEEDKAPTLFTAYNIWKGKKMKCINFKEGTEIIPAGTEVTDVRLQQQYSGSPILFFTTVQDGQRYTIRFTKRWHPKTSMEDYKEMMFTPKNFEAQTAGLTEMEIDAIKKGVLVDGMSKRAVFICYGRPPEHYTPKLAANTWYYWENRGDKIEINFDQNGRLDLSGSKAAKEAEETDGSIIQSGGESGTQVAAIPEPWTGIWEVEANPQEGSGVWELKQRGKSVVSTRDSLYKVKGKVKGNRLKGHFIDSTGKKVPITLKISQDGHSFDGTMVHWGRSHPVNGKRK